MTRQEMVDYAKSQIEEFTDSSGDVDAISLIDHLQSKLGIPPKLAESVADEALGYGE